MPLAGEYEPGALEFARDQVAEIEASNGTRGTTINGLPVVVITSLGARSGKLRKNPVMRVEHEGQYVAVASLGGAPKHPTWYFNLKAHPLVEVQDGPIRKDYVARELEGAERELWWDRAVAAFAGYDDYRAATDRLMPVFLLTEQPTV